MSQAGTLGWIAGTLVCAAAAVNVVTYKILVEVTEWSGAGALAHIAGLLDDLVAVATVVLALFNDL